MKNILLPIFLISLILSSCSGKKTDSQTSEVPESQEPFIVNLTPQEFSEKSSNRVVLDVRTSPEVALGKIEGAVAIDYFDPEFLSKVSEYPKDQEIYIYCAVGARSQDAAKQLIQQGFTKIYHLQGGINAWTESGLPIE
jgi:rhodanese-related sulfurtransferase